MANRDAILIFVKVAQFENIRRAARSLGNTDLDGEPAAIGAGIESWGVAPEAHDATGRSQ